VRNAPIAPISFAVLLGFKKIPEPILTVGAGVAGALLHHGSCLYWEEVMQTKLFSLRSAVCAFLLLGSLSSANVFGQTLKQVAAFDLPGPGGKRFDYLTIDADDHYLISAHLAAGQTYVIDLRTNKVVATVTDTPGAEGVEYIPELKKFYTSNAGDNTIGVVDLKQMKVIAG
jgi:hypothetical protein